MSRSLKLRFEVVPAGFDVHGVAYWEWRVLAGKVTLARGVPARETKERAQWDADMFAELMARAEFPVAASPPPAAEPAP